MIKSILFHASAYCDKLWDDEKEDFNRIRNSSFISEANRMMKGFLSFILIIALFVITLLGVAFIHFNLWELLHDLIGMWFLLSIPLEVILIMYVVYLQRAYKIKKGYEKHYEKAKQNR